MTIKVREQMKLIVDESNKTNVIEKRAQLIVSSFRFNQTLSRKLKSEFPNFAQSNERKKKSNQNPGPRQTQFQTVTIKNDQLGRLTFKMQRKQIVRE